MISFCGAGRRPSSSSVWHMGLALGLKQVGLGEGSRLQILEPLAHALA